MHILKVAEKITKKALQRESQGFFGYLLGGGTLPRLY